MAAAFHQREHHFLVAGTRAYLAAGLTAPIGLVSLNGLAARAHQPGTLTSHRQANTVPHKPRTLEGYPKGPVKLIGADTLLAGRYEEDCLQPEVQRDMAVLEDGADLHGKGLAAGVALPNAKAGALALKFPALV